MKKKKKKKKKKKNVPKYDNITVLYLSRKMKHQSDFIVAIYLYFK